MKKAAIAMSLSLYARLLAAQPLDVSALEGESWYGLYLNGQKAGYSMTLVEKRDDGSVAVAEDAQFHIKMAGINQDMSIKGRRIYGVEGDLVQIDSSVTDVSGTTKFRAVIDGGELVLDSEIGGASTRSRLPKPKESLRDALKQLELVRGGGQLGERVTFSVFEPMYAKEISGVSEIIGQEERMFDGVTTKVYKVKTRLDVMNLETISYVAEDGTTLEDVVAGIITMRLEPEELAKDVNYTNDVVVSNAARIQSPIKDPRTRKSLALELRGPITESVLFSDGRQSIEAKEGAFRFTSKLRSAGDIPAVELPITEPSVQEWLKPGAYVQSDHPRLIEKAKEIVGEEKNALAAAEKICGWVHDNMRSTYSARLTNALEVLSSLEGDCTEHSVLFTALARAAGIPAREVAGLIYISGPQSGFYFHQWSKVWVGEWVDMDPAFDQPFVDVTHIKLSEGDIFEQMRLIPVIGQLDIKVVQ